MLSMIIGKEINGRYVAQCNVGSGGYGTVWRAADKQLNRDVALKRLLKIGVATPAEQNGQPALLKLENTHAACPHEYCPE